MSPTVKLELCKSIEGLSAKDRASVYKDFEEKHGVAVRTQRRWVQQYREQMDKGYTPKFNRTGRPRVFDRESCEIGVERYEKEILKNRRAHVGDIDLFNHLIVAKKEQLAEAGKPAEFKQPSIRTMYRTLSVMATPGPHQLIVPKKPQKTDQNRLDSASSVRNAVCFAVTAKLLTLKGLLFETSVKGFALKNFDVCGVKYSDNNHTSGTTMFLPKRLEDEFNSKTTDGQAVPSWVTCRIGTNISADGTIDPIVLFWKPGSKLYNGSQLHVHILKHMTVQGKSVQLWMLPNDIDMSVVFRRYFNDVTVPQLRKDRERLGVANDHERRSVQTFDGDRPQVEAVSHDETRTSFENEHIMAFKLSPSRSGVEQANDRGSGYRSIHTLLRGNRSTWRNRFSELPMTESLKLTIAVFKAWLKPLLTSVSAVKIKLFCSLLCELSWILPQAFHERPIRKSFAMTGLWPYNLEIILSDTSGWSELSKDVATHVKSRITDDTFCGELLNVGVLRECYMTDEKIPVDATCATSVPREDCELMRRRAHCINLPSAIARHLMWLREKEETKRLAEERKREREAKAEARRTEREEKKKKKSEEQELYSNFVNNVVVRSREATPWNTDWTCKGCGALYSVWVNSETPMIGAKTWYSWVSCSSCPNMRLCGRCKYQIKLNDHKATCPGVAAGASGYNRKPKKPSVETARS